MINNCLLPRNNISPATISVYQSIYSSIVPTRYTHKNIQKLKHKYTPGTQSIPPPQTLISSSGNIIHSIFSVFMSSFSIDIASSRPSLQSCIRELNALCEGSTDNFSRLVLHTLREESRSTGEDVIRDNSHLIPGLQFILGAGTKNKISSDDLNAQLRAYTDLSDTAVDIMCQCYGAQKGDCNSSATTLLGLGKFVNLDWKVGVSVQSSNCDNLCVPYVSLVVRISKSGIVEAHSMELSMKEFGEFATSVKEMQLAMEGL